MGAVVYLASDASSLVTGSASWSWTAAGRRPDAMFETTITPRVSETDGAGHINNVFVPVWFEAGRREIFRILTPDLSFTHWRATLVNMNVDYLAQIYLNEDVQVRTWIERIGDQELHGL